MDPGTILLAILVIVVVWLVLDLDLLFAGGGMMAGMAGMMGDRASAHRAPAIGDHRFSDLWRI